MKLPFTEFYTDQRMGLLELIRSMADSDAPAVSCRDRSLSYRELNRISDTVAALLQEEGVEKGDMVAVDMLRSERYPCAIFGVLKAGACCVPMEHGWPQARKQAVYSAAAPKVIVTEERYAAMLEGGCREQTRPVCCMPGDPMVMIFTSGSSGVPKGINLTYSVWRVAYDMICYRSLSEENRSSGALQGKQLITGSFSAYPGTMAVLTTTAAGRHICIATEREAETSESIAGAILEHDIGMAAFTPTFLRAALQDSLFRKAVGQLRYILLSGGALTQGLCDQLRECNPDILTWNIYGMSEVSCITAGYIRDDIRNVGRPAPNTLVAILDENGQDVGVGEPGEICVGTKKITTSYMNDPELDRQKHFLHPEYGPLFRTGDLGWGDEEGNLHHMGRMDRMVKIRDVRVELDEIERTIASFPGVRQGLAAARGTEEDRFIVGYYLSDAPLEEEALRRHMLATLPQSYMPRFLMRLETVPMTETGKVAYPLLPVPAAGEGIAYESPATEQERCLCAAVGQVLKLEAEQVSAEAGFARLGGDSIRAMMVCSRLRDRGWKLRPHVLYSELTLRRAAEEMERAGEAEPVCVDTAVRGISGEELRRMAEAAGGESNVEEILPLSFETDLALKRVKQGESVLNLARLIRIEQGMDEERFRRRVQALVRCHPALRSRLAETGTGKVCQVILKEQEPSCYYRDLRYLADGTALPNEKQMAFCNMYMNFLASSRRPDGEELLPHFICFRFADRLSGVGVCCSHANLDGWSSGILLEELAAPEDPAEVDHYIEYMQQYSGKNKAGDLRFWREYLKGVEVGRQIIPMKPEWKKGTTELRRVLLGEELSRRLERYRRERGISLPVLMQYLAGRVLCRVLEQPELLLEVCFAARGAEVSREDRIVGNLVRICPLLCGEGRSLQDFREDMHRVQKHMAPNIGEIFAAAGLWASPVMLIFTTNELPGKEVLSESTLYVVSSTNVAADALDVAVFCLQGRLGAQFAYNPLIFPEERMAQVEEWLRELAEQLLEAEA